MKIYQNIILDYNIIFLFFASGGCKSENDALSIGFVLTPPTKPAENLQIWLWIFCVVTLTWIPSCVTLIGRGITLHTIAPLSTKLIKFRNNMEVYYKYSLTIESYVYFQFVFVLIWYRKMHR